MSRYSNYRILNNSNEYYRKLRQERNNIKNIRQFETPILRHPTVGERARLETTQHIWTTGDRYYKLANTYYNNPTLWWVIAWYNALPTEADVLPGDLITIPLDIENVLELFGI
tara:strand:+ start:22500 stop:22838 length:339 start_codon:yes stop_codon:yes gene_type:complete